MEKKKRLAREFSAGGLVYKKDGSKIRWLLMQPAGTDRWQIPKGKVEQGESVKRTALREVFEETGIKAAICERVDQVHYFYVRDGNKISKTVVFFLMKYKQGKPHIADEWAKEVDDIKWFETSEAEKKITFKTEKGVLAKGKERVG